MKFIILNIECQIIMYIIKNYLYRKYAKNNNY